MTLVVYSSALLFKGRLSRTGRKVRLALMRTIVNGSMCHRFRASSPSSQVSRSSLHALIFTKRQTSLLIFLAGDMMQYLTNSYLPSTPHKVGLNTAERFAFAYFHEPNFSAVVKPVPEYSTASAVTDGIHYGKHFTNMFMRNYPERITAKRIEKEGRMGILEELVAGHSHDSNL
jgi:2OG-Fe(II) oxygenase superfamily